MHEPNISQNFYCKIPMTVNGAEDYRADCFDNVAEDFIFLRHDPWKMRLLCCLKMLGSNYQVKQHHIPEQHNPKLVLAYFLGGRVITVVCNIEIIKQKYM